MTRQSSTSAQWRLRRGGYYAGLVLVFASVALYFGPNRILFGKWTWIAPRDFAPTVERRCVEVVRAMKAYERDHGRRPERMENLVPDYLPAEAPSVTIAGGKFSCWTQYNHVIVYDFPPAREGWRVEGGFCERADSAAAGARSPGDPARHAFNRGPLMYCQKCYADLSAVTGRCCPKCRRNFNPAEPKSYLRRPFPSMGRIISQIILTTLLAAVAAYGVAMHQAARTSGH